MTTCRSCDAEVVFVPSAKSGKAMILDAKPAKGVVILTKPSVAAGIVGPVMAPGHELAAASVVDVYTDHHATCPNAADWKGKRR